MLHRTTGTSSTTASSHSHDKHHSYHVVQPLLVPSTSASSTVGGSSFRARLKRLVLSHSFVNTILHYLLLIIYSVASLFRIPALLQPFIYVAPIQTSILAPSSTTRHHSLFLQLTDRFFRLTPFQSGLTGAIFFILLCYLPIYWRSGLVPENIVSTYSQQEGWQANEAQRHPRVNYQPLTSDQMKEIIQDALEAESQQSTSSLFDANPILPSTPPSTLHLYLATLLSDAESKYVLTPPTLNPFTLGYQKVRPWKIGRYQDPQWPLHSSTPKFTPEQDEYDEMNPALKDWNGPTSSSIAATSSTIATDDAKFEFEFAHNRYYPSEYQFTEDRRTPVEETRRVRLLRNYTQFPSTVPSFLSSDVLQQFEPIAYYNAESYPRYADIPVPPRETFLPERLLVIYTFGYNHDEYLQNMEYFIRDCVREHHEIDYVFLINQIEQREVDIARLPKLPSNARYIQHRNECYDWGTVGWLINLQREIAVEGEDMQTRGGYKLDPTRSKYHIRFDLYKYFIIMNSSVRGPFFPSYIDLEDPRNRWWVPYLHVYKRDPYVKLVGPLISCQIHPHVQSYLMVIDQETFTLLRGISSDQIHAKVLNTPNGELPASPVFECHDAYWDAIFQAELGSSFQVLKSGFNIGTLTTMYREVDFRSAWMQDCLQNQQNPSQSELLGGFVTTGPHSTFMNEELKVIIAHQQQLYADLEKRYDQHDLYGDVLTPEEVEQRQAWQQLMNAVENDEEEDWAFTENSASPAITNSSSSQLTPTRKRLNLDLNVQLHIITTAKQHIVQESIKRVMDRDEELMAEWDPKSGQPHPIVPMKSSKQRRYRTRPDLLVSDATRGSPHGIDTKYDSPLTKVEVEKLIDLNFLKQLSQEILSWRHPFTHSSSQESPEREEEIRRFRERYPNFYSLEESRFLSTSGPISPNSTLWTERVEYVANKLALQAIAIDPLEVLFGKFKKNIHMHHIMAYDEWRLDAAKRQMHNRERAIRQQTRSWLKENDHGWRRSWRQLHPDFKYESEVDDSTTYIAPTPISNYIPPPTTRRVIIPPPPSPPPATSSPSKSGFAATNRMRDLVQNVVQRPPQPPPSQMFGPRSGGQGKQQRGPFHRP